MHSRSSCTAVPSALFVLSSLPFCAAFFCGTPRRNARMGFLRWDHRNWAAWRHQFVFECDRIGDHIQTYTSLRQNPRRRLCRMWQPEFTPEALPRAPSVLPFRTHPPPQSSLPPCGRPPDGYRTPCAGLRSHSGRSEEAPCHGLQ